MSRTWLVPIARGIALALLWLLPAAAGTLDPADASENRARSAVEAPIAEPGADPLAVRVGDGISTERYIVELVDPPILAYRGGRAGLPATAPKAVGLEAGRKSGLLDDRGRIAVDSAPVRAYADHLAERRAAFLDALAAVAPGARADYHYRLAFNGIALRLESGQLEAVRTLPGLRSITPAEQVVPLMDASLPLIGAPGAWAHPAIGGRTEAGRGQRIAVIDSGITAAHPFFDPEGFEAPEGFPRSSLRIGERVLDYEPAQREQYTNAKVIVARAYVNPELVDPASETDPREQYTPLADGPGGFHGAHVAGTAAGRLTLGAPGSSSGGLELSGVAPGAYLMAYKFNNAYTPEILAMIEDAVADGADVINNSWGTAAMNLLPPGEHPVARAFEAAIDAGVVVVAAAGNAGSTGEASLGGPHQMSPRVITVANSQTGRGFDWRLTASGEGLPAELESHPTAYEAFGADFSVIEKPAARLADFCNPLGLAFGAAGKVVLEPMSGSCPIPGFELPVELPDELGWLTKLLLAGVANAATPQPAVESIVFYAPEGDPTTLVGLLGLLDQVAPFFEQLGLAVKFPIVSIITGPDAMALADWADENPGQLRLRLDGTPLASMAPELVDAANPTSSQGPAPRGPWNESGLGALKPDLSAPGTDIVSASTDAEGAPEGYALASGTSMSSPHVAGAAAVLGQAHPDWGPEEIKSALMVTSAPSVTVESELAPARVQGAGRLDLARAVDPGLLILPPAVDLRTAAGDELTIDLRLRDVRGDADSGISYALREEPGVGAMADRKVFAIAPAQRVSLAASGEAELQLRSRTEGLVPGVYDGWIVFEEAEAAGAGTGLRLRYRLEIPGDRKDVLLLDLRRRSAPGGGAIPGIPGLPGGGGFEDGPDYLVHWRSALDAAGLSHEVWTVADGAEDNGPPLSVLQGYDLVILAAGDGDAPLDRMERGMTSLQMYLLGGGRLLVSGYAWRHEPQASQLLGLQNQGAMYLLSRYFAGFERTEDDHDLAADGRSLRPLRIFDRPVALASEPGGDHAGNGDLVDLGRPLAALRTTTEDGGLAPDLGLAAPLVVDRILPYMRAYLELPGQGAVMTGVSADATLEQAERAEHIPWGALFAGFAIESVAPQPGHTSRAELLAAAHAWATEPDGTRIEINGPATLRTGEPANFRAEPSLADGVRIVRWRWDRGDGRAFASTDAGSLSDSWMQAGRYTLRAEGISATGHSYVGSLSIEVTGPNRLFIPTSFR